MHLSTPKLRKSASQVQESDPDCSAPQPVVCICDKFNDEAIGHHSPQALALSHRKKDTHFSQYCKQSIAN